MGQGAEYWRADSPRGFLTDAREFRDIGRCAMDNNYARRAPFPVYYLLLHAIELALKGYLRQVNAVTMKELRGRKYGHNISKLLKKAIGEDLRSCCSLSDEQIQTLNALSHDYAGKEFEYFRLGLYKLPAIEFVARAADVLVDNIGRMDLRTAKDSPLRPQSPPIAP